ncbi:MULTISPECIES: Crp/Fnr family transcriptional regulator [Lelliottia]|uniref:Crp/Fnr family transcriptional regulator n=1 Tax=Lelliottia aquatilis TaxID=2080838 RepID=A0ABX4ZXE1_9ENTR|nr:MULTISPECIES: Crp/Fnr family transcriptional regulator [Lelliottia]POZ16186.1 Crp/Fnr family transcriptional regulator [Lelliottia aquatilis]POZ16230.1 Crp/Fnr family transcriptional regulator [Lelliottia sp. 7254-16]POZ20544.1 Crp/Fnr family transcriptional regulator [Lelliottia aquatilis]POZ22051.1 Crp/Fnr family transcriptional regulator [Lelliottia aquatilis]POZ33103.1 Crp/Fnr family transcriptional regulator [Lelliottia aquatilis]
MTRERAEYLICQRGWLSLMPEDFRTRLLKHALLLKFEPGQFIFRTGAPAGGIFGLVDGTVVINTAPLDSVPRLIHIAVPGGWTGEDSFLTGDTRRIEVVAQSETWILHVPIKAMEQMVSAYPNDIRAFGVISIQQADSALRIVHDLQKRNISSRIASALHRMSWSTDSPVTVSQDNLSIITNTSRKQVNNVIQRFVEEGWVETSYRSITVKDPSALLQHAEKDISN